MALIRWIFSHRLLHGRAHHRRIPSGFLRHVPRGFAAAPAERTPVPQVSTDSEIRHSSVGSVVDVCGAILGLTRARNRDLVTPHARARSRRSTGHVVVLEFTNRWVSQVPLSRRVLRAAVVGVVAARLEGLSCVDHHGQGAVRTHPVVERWRLHSGSELRWLLRAALVLPANGLAGMPEPPASRLASCRDPWSRTCFIGGTTAGLVGVCVLGDCVCAFVRCRIQYSIDQARLSTE